ncbi:MAG: ABC-ATPase domain-containing protein [Bacillota bacterium]
MVSVTRDAEYLRAELARIDGRGYKAYKDIRGSYRVDEFELYVDYVQGDPFASPSKLRVRLDGRRAGFPRELYSNADRRRALQDYILRAFDRALSRVARGHRGSGKSGMLAVDRPGQEVLERTAVVVDPEFTEVRLAAGLPARGRRVLGGQAAAMLLDEIPAAARASLYCEKLNGEEMRDFVVGIEDAAELRRQLGSMGAVAFAADGSILPRESGVSELPLPAGRAVPFESPPSLAREVTLPSGRRVRGMAIPEGVTLIVGGGYHGKSTLLRAIDRGIYDHIPGDGRELVVAEESAVKNRAEDGRQVTGVDISPFIKGLPGSEDTSCFSTPAASGSTSQAANIAEALEMGSRVLLVDEDTSATNFMVRDMRMQRLVAAEKEPITPFIDRVRQLHRERGVSTVVVVGGSGDYFDVADTVIMMDHYRPRDVTAEAAEIARQYPTGRTSESPGELPGIRGRHPDPSSVDPRRRGRVRVKTRGLSTVQFGEEEIDLGLVEQLVDPSQTRAVADILQYARKHFPQKSLREAFELVEAELDRKGMDILSPFSGHPGDYARPRMLEAATALNRLRSLRLRD